MESKYKNDINLLRTIIENAENNYELKKQIVNAGYTEKEANKVSILIAGMILANNEF
ncbi:hypothetical protein [Listeria seeligeri]|uniref:hypothetical protein n=1 Tax=Listeria seeligeri TaxID=1640 RepID=UPI0016234684|nr:hypothetical protein [Listeria seeligeri]MBC1824182.1 hypothetical protein [Listeria seeligeri]MBC1837884.1 hypothetical protein [Listeria seeligeri]